MEETSDEILLAINTYQKQLEEVNAALENADENSSQDLRELQLNLIEILELTLSKLDNLENQNTGTGTSTSIPSKEGSCLSSRNIEPNNLESELELFKQEIASLGGSKELSSVSDIDNDKIDLLKELHELEGKQVRVPYTERWGGFSYHNAMIFKLIIDSDGEPDYSNPKVSVLFNQPTSLSMLPCRYYLDGKCKFDAVKCNFSHGEEVLVSELRDFIELDKDAIQESTKCLVLHDSNEVWHQGMVQDILQDRSAVSFNCSVCQDVLEVTTSQLVPLLAQTGDDQIREESTSEKSSFCLSAIIEEEEDPSSDVINVITSNVNNSNLGQWEKFTNGIGSKLMAKMGYIFGEGLGPSGTGRVDPVPAYAYPQGVSLDHCMMLRLKSKGEDMYQVEKKLLKQQQVNEDKMKKQEESLAKRTSVFDIINNRLGGGTEPSTSSLNEGNTKKKKLSVQNEVLKADSSQELNRKNFQLSSRISTLNKEVQKLKEAKKRQMNDKATVESLEKRIRDKEQELVKLQDSESRIKNEQRNRKRVKKITLF